MKTVIHIKVDKDVKEKAMKVAKDMGVPLSIIINTFLKQFIRYRHVTFTNSKPSKKLERILKPFFLT